MRKIFSILAIALALNACAVVPIPIFLGGEDPSPSPTGEDKTCDADALNNQEMKGVTLPESFLEKQATDYESQGNHALAVKKHNEAMGAYMQKTELIDNDLSDFDSIAALKEKYPQELQRMAEYAVKIGRNYSQLQKYENAVHCFSRAMKFRINKPNDATAYLNRGDAYQKLGERDKAIEDFTTASALFKEYKLPTYQKIADDRIKGLSSPSPTK